MIEKEGIIHKSEEFVREYLEPAEGSHDWWHTWRVWRLAVRISLKENADIFITSLGALFHDIADPKFHDGDEEKGIKITMDFLSSHNVDEKILLQVEDIIKRVSFKGGLPDPLPKSPELKCVQDADRLDAMGAIGIARAFSYGGYKGRKIHEPGQDIRNYSSIKAYRESDASTINHFYEKLLLLKNLMNTKTGKKLAKKRHKFLKLYLKEFFREMR